MVCQFYLSSQRTSFWLCWFFSTVSFVSFAFIHAPIFFPIIFISWRLITLQYCSGFIPYIHMNQPCIYMCSLSWTPPPTSLLIPPLWVIPVHQPLALVSCIQPGLVICFTLNNIHVLMLFSQIIPPLLSPIESKNLFCTSMSHFLPILHIGLSLPLL